MYFLETIKKDIAKEINKALGKNLVQASDLIYPPRLKMGDLSLPCFKNKIKPDAIAKDTIKLPAVSRIKWAGPYLNFTINKEYLGKEVIKKINKQKEKYGQNKNLKDKKIMVEFAHPNPFKSFHIGHLRNIILGEAIVRMLEAQGAKIIRVNYQGDVGMHIAKCLWAFKKIDPEKYPKTADEKVALLGKCYAQGAKVFDKDKLAQKKITEINKKIYSGEDKEINRLWDIGRKWSLEKFHEIYKRVYTFFDKEYMESEMIKDAMKYIKKAKEKNILKESKGALIFDGTPYNLDTRVFLNSEGLPTYEGKELGLAYKEFKDFGKINLCIHNVAVEQISFFKVTFKVQELLDPRLFKNKQYHNAYEFVGLKKGKMSSRKGEVILGNDILNEAQNKILKIMKNRQGLGDLEKISEKIGIGAIKYSFLKISPFKYLAFDLGKSVSFEGDSGPYLLYTYVRINSISKKSKKPSNAAGRQKIKKARIDFNNLTESKEQDIIMKLAKYPEIVERAGKKYDPSEITKYLFELAKNFNDYYHSVPVLKSEAKTRQARLELLSAISQVIKNGLELLGIETVEEM